MSNVIKKLIGDTIKITWVESSVTPTTLIAAIYNGSNTVVDSVTMTSSGNGHFYSPYTLPNTLGWYVAETIATIGGSPYKNRIKFKAVSGETD